MAYKSPVYHVIPVPIEKVRPNTYNPNAVAPPEMRLLYESIRADGYTCLLYTSPRPAAFATELRTNDTACSCDVVK